MTTMTTTLVHVVLEETWFSIDELCRVAAVSPQWLDERLQAGLLAAEKRDGGQRFDARALRRARAMVRIEQDFDAVPELAALVVDLQDEIERLRRSLQRLGG